MKKFSVYFMFLTAALIFYGENEKEIKKWEKETWQISIKADYPDIFPQALQFAVFKKNPIKNENLIKERVKKVYLENLLKSKKEGQYDITKSSQMYVIWDTLFSEISGDRVYIIPTACDPKINDKSENLYENLDNFILSSNDIDGDKWIVTKPAYDKEGIVCWIIHVKVKKGEEVSILLDKNNSFDWEKEFNKKMFGNAVDPNR